MKSRLLWERFLSHWLPPEKATGDVERDIGEALRVTYELPDGKGATFAQKGGLSTVVVTEATTVVASRIPSREAPHARPNWLDWRGPLAGKEQAELRNDAIRDLVAKPRPHVIVKTGKRFLTLGEIVLGAGTVVVVNEPGRTMIVDSVRIARARRALKVFRSADRARKARRLADEREAAAGETAAIDRKIRTMIGRLAVEPDIFFDAVDLLDGVSPLELNLAAEAP